MRNESGEDRENRWSDDSRPMLTAKSYWVLNYLHGTGLTELDEDTEFAVTGAFREASEERERERVADGRESGAGYQLRSSG